MLENIQNTSSDIITQSNSLEKITGLNTDYNVNNEKNFFIDQSDISALALEKYQREEDIKSFSSMLMEMNEDEANNKVISDVFNGLFSIENSNVLANLLDNEDFINDVIG